MIYLALISMAIIRISLCIHIIAIVVHTCYPLAINKRSDVILPYVNIFGSIKIENNVLSLFQADIHYGKLSIIEHFVAVNIKSNTLRI